MTTLVLASTSRYRRALLDRLGLPFTAIAPEVDETPEPGEHPAMLAARLAASKATSQAPAAGSVARGAGSVARGAGIVARGAGSVARGAGIVIGADQVPSLDGEPLGKPRAHAQALAQLEACQGKTVIFHTAVAVYDVAAGQLHEHVDQTRVEFASRTRAELERYLELEPAYDCAGGFKAEGLGVALFESIESRDPTALIGLPLIWLAATLRECGLDPLGQHD